MTDNAEQLLAEAKQRTLLGEVAVLEESLRHLRARRDEADQRLVPPGDELTGEFHPIAGHYVP